MDIKAEMAGYGEDAVWLSAQIEVFWSVASEAEASDGSFDNFRVARAGDKDSEERFNEAESEGCCGCGGGVFGPSPLGHTYWYGFNYGH